MKTELILDLLDRALGEEMGLVITTNNPDRMSKDIHAVTQGVDKYKSLMITVPSTPETVMIVKRMVELDDLGEPDV